MDCPYCTTSLPDDDLFCEACGKPVHAAAAQNAGEGCTCGAPTEEIDGEGYCGRCGRLARRPATDHIEDVLSPDFAGASDRGQKHQRNEDRFAVRQVGDAYVIVVCDGVSSSKRSEIASSAVAEHVANALEASLRRHSASSPERTVRTAILDAQAKLEAMDMPEGDPPSTTIVAALVKGSDAAIGWAGDSRAYWIDGDASRQLTTDHSWMNDVVASGAMSVEQASKAPQAHGITHWLGSDAGDNAQPDVVHFTMPGPGHLLLCTDGLWNYAPEPEELAELVNGDAAIDLARKMIDFANEHGGHDNITAVLLRSAATDSKSN